MMDRRSPEEKSEYATHELIRESGVKAHKDNVEHVAVCKPHQLKITKFQQDVLSSGKASR
jgi:hypothetical protein